MCFNKSVRIRPMCARIRTNPKKSDRTNPCTPTPLFWESCIDMLQRIRILHRLRVYSTYVRKRCKTRIRSIRVQITGKREISGSDSFGFVPFFRIRSDSFRLVEFYGVRGLCVFFVHMLGPPPRFSMICGFSSFFFAAALFSLARVVPTEIGDIYPKNRGYLPTFFSLNIL